MKQDVSGNQKNVNRRNFIKGLSAGVAGIAAGGLGLSGCTRQIVSGNAAGLHRRAGIKTGSGNVSFTTGSDQRETAYQVLKPLQSAIERDIGDKQVVIKINSGQVGKDLWLNATDPKWVQGILDFLKPIYDRTVIVAESTAAGAQSTLTGFENYGFMPLLKEYDAKFVDLNDRPTKQMWIQNDKQHPLDINIIDTFLDPNIYMISATRLKAHNCVVATLALKNVVMAAPINHYRQKEQKGRNEKPKMHQGGNRGLSHNMFRLAAMGIQPDLAVLDGVVGMEGDGPVRGTAIEQGVAVASTDWLAADRIGVELMGMDYDEVKYLHWCSDAGMGQDDLAKIKIIGPDYKPHVTTYKL
ncbi:DUF362 domain-containing protein, partial [Candidatus Latescibacterota bacterium]